MPAPVRRHAAKTATRQRRSGQDARQPPAAQQLLCPQALVRAGSVVADTPHFLLTIFRNTFAPYWSILATDRHCQRRFPADTFRKAGARVICPPSDRMGRGQEALPSPPDAPGPGGPVQPAGRTGARRTRPARRTHRGQEDPSSPPDAPGPGGPVQPAGRAGARRNYMPRKARTGGTPPGPGMPAPAAAPVSASTLTSIAAEAGVSISTVSKVLNGRTDVAPATRERIGLLLRRHGYQPGSQLSSGVVDLLLGTGPYMPGAAAHNPWAEQLIHGAAEAAAEAGLQRGGQHGELGRRVSPLAGTGDRPRHLRGAERSDTCRVARSSGS